MRHNWLLVTDTQHQVAAARQLLRPDSANVELNRYAVAGARSAATAFLLARGL